MTGIACEVDGGQRPFNKRQDCGSQSDGCLLVRPQQQAQHQLPESPGGLFIGYRIATLVVYAQLDAGLLGS
jgi:hypothetical protein